MPLKELYVLVVNGNGGGYKFMCVLLCDFFRSVFFFCFFFVVIAFVVVVVLSFSLSDWRLDPYLVAIKTESEFSELVIIKSRKDMNWPEAMSLCRNVKIHTHTCLVCRRHMIIFFRKTFNHKSFLGEFLLDCNNSCPRKSINSYWCARECVCVCLCQFVSHTS